MADRVLVSGVTGFVGHRLATELTEAGYEVDGLSRDPDRAKATVPALREALTPDSLDGAALEDVTAIVHLAGESVAGRWTEAKKRRILSSRVDGTRQIVDAIAEAETKPEVLVSASAMGFYGSRGDDELSEDEPEGDDFLATVCVAWEREAMRAAEYGVRVVRLRIGLVLGPDGGALEAMLTPFRLGLGGKIGDGQQWWSWIHREDLVRLAVEAVGNDAFEGPYNAVSPQPVRQAEFATTLAAVLGKPAFLPAPAFAVKAALGGFAVELLASRRLVPQRARQQEFWFRHTDLEATLRDIL